MYLFDGGASLDGLFNGATPSSIFIFIIPCDDFHKNLKGIVGFNFCLPSTFHHPILSSCAA